MPNIVIQSYPETENAPVFRELQSLFEQIRKRAYELFERRGGAEGAHLEDWLTAEREALWSPTPELTENDGEFNIRVAVAGFDTKQIHVNAMPDCIVVKAETTDLGEEKHGGMGFNEFAKRTLFCRIDLPAPIDVDMVKATLDKGMLLVTAKKAAKTEEKEIAIGA